MAFDDVVFPEIACKGVHRDEIYPVEVIGNGKTQSRSSPLEWSSFVWKITSVGMTNETKNITKSFIRRRNHGLNSFKFRDPDHPLLNNEVLGHSTGSTWFLNLGELDESGNPVPGVHPIFHPDLGNLTILVNGSPGSGSFGIVNGYPTLNVVGTNGSEVVTVSGPYWIAVTLKSTLGWTIATLAESGPDVIRTSEFELEEVFEY